MTRDKLFFTMISMPILVAIGAFIFTLLGGLFALRFKDKLHLILGFSAGAVIGVAFFDLIPEAIELAGENFEISFITSLVALGFIGYMILDRSVILHSHTNGEMENGRGGHDDSYHANSTDRVNHAHSGANSRGKLGASSLSIHSFLDGAAIGLAFQVSAAVGAIVAVAVLVHDFSDGINTVNLILKNKGNRTTAFRWLLVAASAPVL